MRVRILGPIDVIVEGRARPVRGVRRRAVLATLALHPGETVGVGRLVDLVWDGTPPASASQTLQSHVSHLRRLLGERSAIVARAPGYQLDIGAAGVDVASATDLIGRGTRETDPERAAVLLRSALDLWRGPALADVPGQVWFEDQARRLEELRRRAAEALVDARLRVGEHAGLIGELRDLVDEEPHREQTATQLMLALYRAGRQSEALTVYRDLRQALKDDLGVDPGKPARDLHGAILRQDPALDPPRSPSPESRGATPDVVPAQLPMAPAGFTGRLDALATLDSLLTAPAADAARDTPAPVVISAVSGTAGIGKTTLAVTWAHRVAGRFPDGQLYVNLRGYDPGGVAVEPAEALRGFLAALGVAPERIPADLSALTGLYRSQLAGRRILVVLDNARDAGQVRPLLPGSPGCLAVITSRDGLTGLVAIEGARPVALDPLTGAEARDLLARRLGADRTDAEPAAVADIIARCAHLPLALALAAARAANQPTFPLAVLAEQMAGSAGTLDALHLDDPGIDIRAVFSWSLRNLSPAAGRLWRLLALHPGPEIAAPAAASLAAVPPADAVRLLGELTRANLLTTPVPGRYALHDLLRAYAAEQAEHLEDGATRDRATLRLLDHHLHTGHAAALRLRPTRDPVVLTPPQPGVEPERPDSYETALAWFVAEHAALQMIIEAAAADGRDTQAWQLGWAFSWYLLRQGYWHERVAVQQVALAATERLGDRTSQTAILEGLARSHTRLGALDDARSAYQRALALSAELGDHAGQAHNHMGLAYVAEQQGRPADSSWHEEQSVALVPEAGSGASGWVLYGQVRVAPEPRRQGEYEQALEYCTEAMKRLVELDHRDGQRLGRIHRGLGKFIDAVDCHQRSIDMTRQIGDRYMEAEALLGLGDTHEAADDPDEARTAWRAALVIYEELNHRRAETVRAKLARL